MGPHHRNSVLMGRNTKEPPSFPFSSSLPPFLSFSTHACVCMRTQTHTHTHEAMWGHKKKEPIYKPGGKPIPGTKPARTMRNTFLSCKPHVTVFCCSSLNGLRQPMFLGGFLASPFIPAMPTHILASHYHAPTCCRIFSNSGTQCEWHWWHCQGTSLAVAAAEAEPGAHWPSPRMTMYFLGLT